MITRDVFVDEATDLFICVLVDHRRLLAPIFAPKQAVQVRASWKDIFLHEQVSFDHNIRLTAVRTSLPANLVAGTRCEA